MDGCWAREPITDRCDHHFVGEEVGEAGGLTDPPLRAEEEPVGPALLPRLRLHRLLTLQRQRTACWEEKRPTGGEVSDQMSRAGVLIIRLGRTSVTVIGGSPHGSGVNNPAWSAVEHSSLAFHHVISRCTCTVCPQYHAYASYLA